MYFAFFVVFGTSFFGVLVLLRHFVALVFVDGEEVVVEKQEVCAETGCGK